ncbi:MAG: nucleotidyltransferase domain-containing protein [Caldisericaceae bacterium]
MNAANLINTDFYQNIVNHSNTLSLVLIGSISRGDYIEGWSDIDFVLVYDSFNQEYFEEVEKLRANLEKSFDIKTGVELVEFNGLKYAVSGGARDASWLKIIKNLNISNPTLESAILYCKQGFTLPLFDITNISWECFYVYFNEVQNYIVKLCQNIDPLKAKYYLRKVIKNSLLIMQTYLLWEYKELYYHFDDVLKKWEEHIPAVSILSLKEAYELRLTWRTIPDNESLMELIKQNIDTFFKVNTYIMEEIRC